ncbi:MAG: DUF2585 family protein [Candidatus Aureabacteria bacterium]|nr:DUF2585 family protein [Candidatus Auribacterota bacterium]
MFHALRLARKAHYVTLFKTFVLDPYSFTHLLHGFIICGLLALIIPRVPALWRLCLAVSFETLWEVAENMDYIIERYRGVTAAIGYQGDTILNSLGDILSFGIGFMVARQLGFRRSVVVFVVTELALLVTYRGWPRIPLSGTDYDGYSQMKRKLHLRPSVWLSVKIRGEHHLPLPLQN